MNEIYLERNIHLYREGSAEQRDITVVLLRILQPDIKGISLDLFQIGISNNF